MEELGTTIGGQGIVAQMTAIDADHADELLDVYREHNDGLHETWRPSTSSSSSSPGLRAQGRRLGIVTAKRHRTVDLALTRFPVLASSFDVVVAARGHGAPQARPDPVLLAVERLGGSPAEAAYVGDSPFDIGAAKAAGVFAIAVGWGGIHPDERLLAQEPDAFVRTPEELLRAI